MAQCVTTTIDQGIAVVTIDNPPMNVLSTRVIDQLEEAFTRLGEDPEVIVVILTGAGERAFMAGGDIKEFPTKMAQTPPDGEGAQREHEVFRLIETLPKGTIAVLNGFTLGGGAELALTCDLRIAEDHVQLGFPEVKLGIFPGAGGTQRLPRLVGPAKAKELMFFGDTISAEEALRLGLVNRVVPKGEGLAEAKALARRLAAHSLQAVSRIKQAVNEGLELPIEEGLRLERRLFAQVFNTADAREGVNAFIEKRRARFTHRE